jgi:hypothetical protein
MDFLNLKLSATYEAKRRMSEVRKAVGKQTNDIY